MPRLISLKNQKEFDFINRCGQKYVGKFFILIMDNTFSVLKSSEHDKDNIPTFLGMKVGRKFGNAIIRNKFKRRMRDIVLNFAKIHPAKTFIIIPKTYASKANYEELKKEFSKLIFKDN